MRIGFVTQLLWNRYGSFWRSLLEDAGAEAEFPEREAVQAQLGDARVVTVPGVSFRLAVAQALALRETDMLLVPSLNHGSESRRGGGQDPWISDFPGALATVRGLPPVLGVPALLAPEQESLAIESLQQVGRDMGRVRRVWDRHKAGLRHSPLAEPSWVATAGKKLVGVVGQPWLISDEVVKLVAPEDRRAIGQHRLDPLRLREEGARVDERMVPTDQETLGAVRLFSRRGSVGEIHLVLDETSGADLWLRDRVEKAAGKTLTVHTLQELAGEGNLEETVLKASG